jgi:phosphoglycolate phosphatase-like HAD superfamily hydrolase
MSLSLSTGLGPRRFAPLSPTTANTHSAPILKGIIFDVDGTLCLPQNHMFREMRSALSIPKEIDILAHIHSLSDSPDQTTSEGKPSSPRGRAVAIIQNIESTAMTQQIPQPGLKKLMSYLHERKVKKALCTRNFPAPIYHLLDKYLAGDEGRFWPIVTRDTVGVRAKPSPEGLWAAGVRWRISKGEVKDGEMDYKEFLGKADGDRVARLARSDENADSADTLNSMADKTKADSNSSADTQVDNESSDPLEFAKSVSTHLIMVGDSIDDLTAGYRAGAATVLIANEDNAHLKEHEYTDLWIDGLGDLLDILEEGFVGRER